MKTGNNTILASLLVLAVTLVTQTIYAQSDKGCLPTYIAKAKKVRSSMHDFTTYAIGEAGIAGGVAISAATGSVIVGTGTVPGLLAVASISEASALTVYMNQLRPLKRVIRLLTDAFDGDGTEIRSFANAINKTRKQQGKTELSLAEIVAAVNAESSAFSFCSSSLFDYQQIERLILNRL